MNEEEINDYIEKAKGFLESARLLFEAKDFDSSVSRIYYALFYATQAVLLTKNLKPKSHGGLINSFSEYFIKKTIFPKSMIKQLKTAFTERQLGDYGIRSGIKNLKQINC